MSVPLTRALVLLGALSVALLAAGPARARLEATPENVEAGRGVYERRCVFCHGPEGAGDGPVADYLDPRPRDFTLAIFKFRTTKTGGLPTDDDLFRTITEGVEGTAMPKWGRGDGTLSEDERWQVLHYIKTLSLGMFDDPEFDPEAADWKLAAPDAPRATPESIAAGDAIFHDIGKGACVKCHGLEGRGDGADSEKGLSDDWGFPIVPRNLREGWRFKRGTRPSDIYMTLQSGLMGTPMPSVADTLSQEETWQLAHYVGSLVDHEDTSGEVVLHAAFADGGVPEQPGDERWAEARPLRVPLTGQVLVAPRWQNPSVQRVTLRACYDETRIAIHASWDDRTQNRGAASPSDPGLRDAEAAPGQVQTYFSVARAVARGAEDLADAVALQFPVALPEGPAKPHFFLGSPRAPVNQWRLSVHPDGAAGDGVEERNARGIDREPTVQDESSQQVTVRTAWRDGQWQAVFVRALSTPDVRDDVQFERGRMIPIAVNAWDASNGEWGLQRSISSWVYLELEQPVGAPVYLASAITAALIAGIQLLLIRRGRGAQD